MSDDEKPTNVLSLVRAREERSASTTTEVRAATLNGPGDGLVVGTCDFGGGTRGVAIAFGTKGELLAITPSQADEYALELVRWAASARAMGEKT